ncbi:MAG: SDR family NAD(P)-dependent oxidoreductase [Polaromonas sp.]|nr:SDR family NAD(P)-dependent oxidoreductase [Polaromonas sp.]
MSDIKTSPHFKSAVITGAGGGLGSALAQQLLDSGCKVALLDIAANRAKTESLRAQHTDLATCFDADVRDALSLKAWHKRGWRNTAHPNW